MVWDSTFVTDFFWSVVVTSVFIRSLRAGYHLSAIVFLVRNFSFDVLIFNVGSRKNKFYTFMVAELWSEPHEHHNGGNCATYALRDATNCFFCPTPYVLNF